MESSAGDVESCVREHSRLLASDEFTGRFPGSPAESLTIDYVSKIFQGLGLTTSLQELSLKKLSRKNRSSLRLRSSLDPVELYFEEGKDFISHSYEELLSMTNVSVVFVGYGIVAPEYDWDDYSDCDVKDKVVIALANDPGLVRMDLFEGEKMTYYGRYALHS
jgi:hypothetical protein